MYNYEIDGTRMRDQYRATGIYINFISTFRIRELDFVAMGNYIIFIFVAMLILHAIIEQLIANNPMHSAEDRAYYDVNKYVRQAVDANRPSQQFEQEEEDSFDDEED
jgi:heme exporter protein D